MAWGAVIGLATSVIGGVMQAKAAKKQSDAQETNAANMQKEAEYQRFRTSILLKRQKEYTQKVLAAQRATYAKNGIQVDTGTALQMAEATAAQSAEDAMLIRQEGEFNVARASSAGSLYQQQADSVRQAGYIQAGSSILTGGWDFVNKMGWVS